MGINFEPWLLEATLYPFNAHSCAMAVMACEANP